MIPAAFVVVAAVVCAAPDATDAAPPAPAPAPAYAEGEHLTGEWGGARTWLAAHGVVVEGILWGEAWAAPSFTRVPLLGDFDFALTLDSAKLGLWPGTTLYTRAEGSLGDGANVLVGSSMPVSGLEAPPLLQVAELYVEQAFVDDKLHARVGRQDSNSDFGTPRYGGNFLNGTTGMPPTVPLPTFPTTGLGVFTTAQATPHAMVKAGLYQRDPAIGDVDLGFTRTFANDAGAVGVIGVDVKNTWGVRNKSSVSAGAWGQTLDKNADGSADGGVNAGAFFQVEQQLFAHPRDVEDQAGMTLILRFAVADPKRNDIDRYAGGSLAWHALWFRDDDTAGVALGWFRVHESFSARSLADARSERSSTSEMFGEAFYKLRLTPFVALEPDVMAYHFIDGRRDVVVVGVRARVKL